MPPKITFFGGVGEIGGNKFLLEDKGTRLFLDFGMNFSERRRFYSDPWLQPRDERGLLEFEIIPKLDGLYRFEDSEPSIDGVILTHSHADHSMSLAFINRRIPVYCGETTALILKSLEETRQRGFETDLSGIEYRTFRTGSKLRIGGLEVEPIHVDHSVPGAYGLIIHTSEGAIAYTGDFRHHGSKPFLTDEFVERASKERPIALLAEGTNIIEAELSSEAQVLEGVKRVLEGTSGLMLAGFSYTDVDRFRTFYEASKACGRSLALPIRQAHTLLQLSKDKALSLPDILSDDSIVVYKRAKRRYWRWEEEIMDRAEVIDSSRVRRSQGNYILVSSFTDLRELIDIRPSAGSSYILSSSEPFNEEAQIEYDRFINWLDHFALPMFHIHCSGHIYPNDLRKAIARIKPRCLIPIHTEHPEMYASWLSDLIKSKIIPRRNESIELKG